MALAPLDLIRSVCEEYPEAEKAFLFGDHEVYRVKKKVFAWLGEGEGGGTYLSVKLKTTQAAALMLPFVTPAAYGMAKWGWVAVQFPKGPIPRELVAEWIDESYRGTAPRKLLAQLDGGTKPGAEAPPRRTKAKAQGKAKTPARKVTARQPAPKSAARKSAAGKSTRTSRAR